MLLKKNTTILAIIAVALLFWVFYMIHYLSKNGYIGKTFHEAFFRESFFRESFASFDSYFRPNNTKGPLIDTGCPDTTHTVSLPINTTYSCENKCGTTGTCYITGEQCVADIDCHGCNPYNSKGEVVGINYNSSLTSNFSDSSEIIDQHANTPLTSNGVDDWTKQAEDSQKLFNQRYKQNIPDSPNKSRVSLTGEFLENGPIPGNYIPMPPNPTPQ